MGSATASGTRLLPGDAACLGQQLVEGVKMQALKDLKLGGRQGVEAVLALRHTLPDSLSLAIPLYCLHIIVFLKSGKVFGP